LNRIRIAKRSAFSSIPTVRASGSPSCMATRPFPFFQTRLALSFSFEEDEQSRRGQTAFLVW
jgi:hypothetical protein